MRYDSYDYGSERTDGVASLFPTFIIDDVYAERVFAYDIRILKVEPVLFQIRFPLLLIPLISHVFIVPTKIYLSMCRTC